MSSGFEINKVPAKIESLTFAKGKPKSDRDNGVGVKRLTVCLDVHTQVHFKKVTDLFPGILDDMTPKKLAAEENPGFEMRSKRKLGTCKVSLLGDDGEVFAESLTARVDRPKLIVEKDAKAAWLYIPIEMAMPKKALGQADDYFKADISFSLVRSMEDIEEVANEKVKKKQAENGAEHVNWTARAPEAEIAEA
jgi:hypothetical protein